jgi:hypothetical protein
MSIERAEKMLSTFNGVDSPLLSSDDNGEETPTFF